MIFDMLHVEDYDPKKGVDFSKQLKAEAEKFGLRYDGTDNLADAVKKGAQVACGGRRVTHKGEPDNLGLYLEPTILSDCNNDMLCMQEETFGPLLPVCKVKSLEEAIEKINASKYGLRASVWSEDKKVIEEFIQKVDSGGIIVNDDHLLFTSRLPHLGGVKASGITGSKYFNLELTYMKYIHKGKG